MLLHICTPCTKWSQSQSTSCSRHSRKFTVEAKTWVGPLTVNSQWNNLLDLKKVPKFWHLGSGSGSATLVDPLQPHWSQWPGRLISGWQDRTFLVNWHLDICSVAATAFFGHQGQLMGTSYVQSIWYQITLPTEGPKHSIWRLADQNLKTCGSKCKTLHCCKSFSGGKLVEHKGSSHALDLAQWVCLTFQLYLTLVPRQLQPGLLSCAIFSAQPITGALKHTAQNTTSRRRWLSGRHVVKIEDFTVIQYAEQNSGEWHVGGQQSKIRVAKPCCPEAWNGTCRIRLLVSSDLAAFQIVNARFDWHRLPNLLPLVVAIPSINTKTALKNGIRDACSTADILVYLSTSSLLVV